MKETQNKLVLAWLESGRTLTALEAVIHLAIYRLSARIYDLKEKGYPIKSELHFEGSKHWSVYSIQKP